MSEQTPRRAAAGVRLSLIDGIAVAAALIIFALLLLATRQAIDRYNDLQTLTERYIVFQHDAMLFQDASDYLTSESRSFAITGDIAHARNFMEEVEVSRRRENAISGIEEHLRDADSYEYLSEGLRRSEALARTELYAIRLAADAFDFDPASLPEGLRAIRLSDEDAAKDADRKRADAVEMLYGQAYQDAKAGIHACVQESVDALIADTRQAQIDASDLLNRELLRQRALIVLLLIMLLVVVLVTYTLAIRPLRRAVVHIRNQREIPVAGSAEMQFLARTYNDMYIQNQRSTEKLTYSATHDSLTGIYNRTAYDEEYRHLDVTNVGMLIIDVDKFKILNDTYGHDVGDKVLKRVAQVITDSFRSNDFISRIGGDEFCVIMRNADSHLRALVEGKIERANQLLQHPTDDLPPVSLSVGVAFGDREAPSSDIFKDADTVLYDVKRRGGGGCAFY
ncbi:MAG: GGDEF domain-containing protein [Clostridia bacterium]|nr:GGDEF domain-containing protein [Clostridia bacterium]